MIDDAGRSAFAAPKGTPSSALASGALTRGYRVDEIHSRAAREAARSLDLLGCTDSSMRSPRWAVESLRRLGVPGDTDAPQVNAPLGRAIRATM